MGLEGLPSPAAQLTSRRARFSSSKLETVSASPRKVVPPIILPTGSPRTGGGSSFSPGASPREADGQVRIHGLSNRHIAYTTRYGSSKRSPKLPPWAANTTRESAAFVSPPAESPRRAQPPTEGSPRRRKRAGGPRIERPAWIDPAASDPDILDSPTTASPRHGELPAITRRQHPQILKCLTERPLVMMRPPPQGICVLPKDRRNKALSWSRLPSELWVSVLEFVDDAVLWRLSRLNPELRQMSLRRLYQNVMRYQEAAAKKLAAVGPHKPLDSRIAEHQAQIIETMQGLAECLTRDDYQQMRSYRGGRPCMAISAIVETCCLVLNKGPLPSNMENVVNKMSWLLVPAKFEIMQHFVAQGDYQPSLQVRQALLHFVLQPELVPEAVRHVSRGAAQYALWLHHVHDYWEILRKIHLCDHSKTQKHHQKMVEWCRRLARLVGVQDVNMRVKTAARSSRRKKSLSRPPTRVLNCAPRIINNLRCFG